MIEEKLSITIFKKIIFLYYISKIRLFNVFMLIYLEKSCIKNPVAQKIISSYKKPEVLLIDHYKNIFDKNISAKIEKSIIIAQVNNAILEAPIWYGFEGKWYFLKNSLNCIYDCSYCYLKGAFKNDIPVFFVNYKDIQEQIKENVKDERRKGKRELIYVKTTNAKKDEKRKVWFYSSDYSDNLATDTFTDFTKTFIPFFETLPNAMMEIRTKSTNISWLLKMQAPKHTEIAFSLNPQEIVTKYEKLTPTLDMRIKAINTLLDAGWLVWVRFLPLLEVPEYQQIYTSFLKYITNKIDFSKVNSVFVGGLMFTYDDYNTILKKEPYLDVLYTLEKNSDGFVREKEEVRRWFYKEFWKYITQKKCNVCLDN